MPYIINLEIQDEKIIKELTKPYLIMLSNEIYLISKQVRSCTWLDLPEEIVPYIEQALIKLIDLENLQYYILPFDLMQNNIMNKYIQIFIYKYDWQKQLFITYINKRDTITGDFIFGKLLGYTDESINEYFIKNKIKEI